MEKSSSIGSNWFEWLEFLEIVAAVEPGHAEDISRKAWGGSGECLAVFFWSEKMHKNAMMLIQESYHESIVPVSLPIFAS